MDFASFSEYTVIISLNSINQLTFTMEKCSDVSFKFGLNLYILKKSKAVPQHVMVAHGGRGGIAPTHS
jgi:hypothetical protein